MSVFKTFLAGRAVIVPVIVLVLIGAALIWLLGGDDAPTSASTDITEALSVDRTGFRTASAGTEMVFPRDHGPHPDYQLEWWYVTGNVYTEEGRRYGYQFTIFRNALAPADSVERAGDVEASDWSTRQLYLAHAALSDVEAEKFYAHEQLSRGASGLAGAAAEPLRVWVEDWSIEQTADELFPWRIKARTPEFELDLQLDPQKSLVLQGDDGFSPKGPDPGQASMYYSYTRIETTGTIAVEGRRHTVSGDAPRKRPAHRYILRRPHRLRATRRRHCPDRGSGRDRALAGGSSRADRARDAGFRLGDAGADGRAGRALAPKLLVTPALAVEPRRPPDQRHQLGDFEVAREGCG